MDKTILTYFTFKDGRELLCADDDGVGEIYLTNCFVELVQYVGTLDQDRGHMFAKNSI